MNIVSSSFFILPIIALIFGAGFYLFGYDISAFSPLSATYNPSLHLPSSQSIGVVVTLFLFIVAVNTNVSVQSFIYTMRAVNAFKQDFIRFLSIIKAKERVETERGSTHFRFQEQTKKGKIVQYVKPYKILIDMISGIPEKVKTSLASEFSDDYRLDFKSLMNFWSRPVYYSESKENKLGMAETDVIFADLQLEARVKFMQIFHEFTQAERAFDDIFKDINEIRGSHIANHPTFLYTLLLTLGFFVQICAIPMSWLVLGWYFGTIYLIFIWLLTTFLVHGIRTLLMIFLEGSEGYERVETIVDSLERIMWSEKYYIDLKPPGKVTISIPDTRKPQ